ncbi:MAG: Trm112 family protein [Sporichthyaceae bacterium]
MKPELVAMLACPRCRAALRYEATGGNRGELVCTAAQCALAYPIRDGVPVLLIDAARAPRPQA